MSTRAHHWTSTLVRGGAHVQLRQALVQLAARGDRPRCGEPLAHELWTSDDIEDRQTAARWCRGCPVLELCRAAGDESGERFGVWGGIDRTPKIITKPRTKR